MRPLLSRLLTRFGPDAVALAGVLAIGAGLALVHPTPALVVVGAFLVAAGASQRRPR